MFGKDFVRDRYGPHPNGFLNYGYSILRAYTARAIMDAGLLPSIGHFHRSYYNSFTLADDLMEPYRPFVDENKKSRKKLRLLHLQSFSNDVWF